MIVTKPRPSALNFRPFVRGRAQLGSHGGDQGARFRTGIREKPPRERRLFVTFDQLVTSGPRTAALAATRCFLDHDVCRTITNITNSPVQKGKGGPSVEADNTRAQYHAAGVQCLIVPGYIAYGQGRVAWEDIALIICRNTTHVPGGCSSAQDFIEPNFNIFGSDFVR